MYWQATLPDGTKIKHAPQADGKPGMSHFELPDVARFEIIEGNRALFTMEGGKPRALRKTTGLRLGGGVALQYYRLVLPDRCVIVCASGIVFTLPDWLPAHDGSAKMLTWTGKNWRETNPAENGMLSVQENGLTTFFRPSAESPAFARVLEDSGWRDTIEAAPYTILIPFETQHHESETPEVLRPDPR